MGVRTSWAFLKGDDAFLADVRCEVAVMQRSMERMLQKIARERARLQKREAELDAREAKCNQSAADLSALRNTHVLRSNDSEPVLESASKNNQETDPSALLNTDALQPYNSSARGDSRSGQLGEPAVQSVGHKLPADIKNGNGAEIDPAALLNAHILQYYSSTTRGNPPPGPASDRRRGGAARPPNPHRADFPQRLPIFDSFWEYLCRYVGDPGAGEYEFAVAGGARGKQFVYSNTRWAGIRDLDSQELTTRVDTGPTAERTSDWQPLCQSLLDIESPVVTIQTILPGKRAARKFSRFPLKTSASPGAAGDTALREDEPEEGKGIVHRVCTMHGAKPWGLPDPAVLNVRVSSKRLNADVHDIIRPHAACFTTLAKETSWVMVDFGYPAVVPSHYSFSSAHPIYLGYYPRSWVFEASRDSVEWHPLREHVDDQTLFGECSAGLWSVQLPPSLRGFPFRYFRVRSTGPNSFGSHELQLSNFEVFGRLLAVRPLRLRRVPSGSPSLFPRDSPGELLPLPLEPEQMKQKKKSR
eukprot:gene170-266_t